jgi:protein SCO1/2
MNVRPRPVVAGLAAAMLMLAAAACDRAPSGPPPLAGAAIGGPFALTDQNGHAMTERSLAGRYRAMYFGYTFCPDVCPTTLQKLMAGYHAFAHDHPAAAARLVPVFVSVDPGRDTPAVMKPYVAAFGPELIGLSGSVAETAKVAKEYGVYYKAEAAPKGAAGYLVDHASQAMLFGPDGAPIALIPTDQGVDAVASTFAEWVR